MIVIGNHGASYACHIDTSKSTTWLRSSSLELFPATVQKARLSYFCRDSWQRQRGSELHRPVAKDAPEQFPAGGFGNGVDKLDTALELHVLGFGDVLQRTTAVIVIDCPSSECERGRDCTLTMRALMFSASPKVARMAASSESTTKASGNSPLFSSGIPTTHASATSGCRSRWLSSSAGETWNPRTLKIS